MGARQLGAALAKNRLATFVGETFDLLGKRRQGRFGVGRDRKVNFCVSLEILVIALGIKIAGADRNQFYIWLSGWRSGAVNLIAERMNRPIEIDDFKANDHICFSDEPAAALSLIQRMARWEVEPGGLVDHGSLQSFGQFNEAHHAGGRARDAVSDNHR